MPRVIAWLDTLAQDARHALRAARNSPGFLAAAVAALALGIGANTAVFSVVDSILLKPVPFAEANRLVMLMITASGTPFFPVSSPAQFAYFEKNADTLEDLAAFASTSKNLTGPDTSVRVPVAEVSEAYFRAFRAPFARGRAFTPEEDSPGGERVVVISEGFWTRYLGADPNAVGGAITLGGDSYTVVGVVDRGFDARELGSPELWTPLETDLATTTQAYLYRVAARLKPGVTLEQAQSQLAALTTGYRERFPGVLGPRAGFGALTLQESFVRSDTRTTLWVLAGAVGFVLLIACANVANLLLVRATGRRGEIAVRRALGASVLRIAQALLIEGLLLSLAGGALGLVIGFAGIRALLSIDTAGLPRLGEGGALIGLDWRVVAFTGLVSMTTGIVFSLVPALAASRTNLVATLNDSSGRAGGGRRSVAHSTLVVTEVAAAVVLMIGAALLVRTSLSLSRVDAGFDSEGLITMQTSLTGARFETTEHTAEVLRQARERLRALSAVNDAVATCCIPAAPGLGLPFNIVGRDDEGLFTGSDAIVFTSPGYFSVFGIPVLRGRGFTADDTASAPPVAIINEALARQYWPSGADPLRDRMLIGGGAGNLEELADEPVRQIVGIVGNVRGAGLASEPGPTMYVPQAQLPDALNALVATLTPTTWVMRTRGGSGGSSRAIGDELRLATGVPVTDSRTMDEVLFRSVSRQRLHMVLMSSFGGLAVLLAAIGIYAVMAYVVQSRHHEIGIRVALGATPSRVRELILRDGLRLIALGLGVGLLAAYFLASMLSAVLFAVEPHDVAVFASVPAAVAVVGVLAVTIPAVRAGRIAGTSATTR
jgi:putative ABC transport system permease protein